MRAAPVGPRLATRRTGGRHAVVLGDGLSVALVRSAFAEHRRHRADRAAAATLGGRLSRERRDADLVTSDDATEPSRWLSRALHLPAMQRLPDEGQLLFDRAGLGVPWTCRALDRLVRRRGCLATDDIVTGTLAQFRLRSLHTLGEEGVNAVALILERERVLANDWNESDLAHDPACAMSTALGLHAHPPGPLLPT